MGMYKYISKTFQDEYKTRDDALKRRIVGWRRESAVERIERPTNIARARKLGYKAKEGVIVCRVKVVRGLRKRPATHRGRKPSKTGVYMAFKKSLQSIAEDRAARRMANCEVLNSYFVGEDGQYKFFEIILLDRNKNSILNDKEYAGIIANRGRAFRGLTSSGVKHRGLVDRSSVRSGARGMAR